MNTSFIEHCPKWCDLLFLKVQYFSLAAGESTVLAITIHCSQSWFNPLHCRWYPMDHQESLLSTVRCGPPDTFSSQENHISSYLGASSILTLLVKMNFFPKRLNKELDRVPKMYSGYYTSLHTYRSKVFLRYPIDHVKLLVAFFPFKVSKSYLLTILKGKILTGGVNFYSGKLFFGTCYVYSRVICLNSIKSDIILFAIRDYWK